MTKKNGHPVGIIWLMSEQNRHGSSLTRFGGLEGGCHCRLQPVDMSQCPKAGAGAVSSPSETEGGEKGEAAGLARGKRIPWKSCGGHVYGEAGRGSAG